MLTVLFLAFLALPPADPDPRCNTAARYEAMAEGADCFNPPARPAKRQKDRK
jgi:hypothetical protein